MREIHGRYEGGRYRKVAEVLEMPSRSTHLIGEIWEI